MRRARIRVSGTGGLSFCPRCGTLLMPSGVLGVLRCPRCGYCGSGTGRGDVGVIERMIRVLETERREALSELRRNTGSGVRARVVDALGQILTLELSEGAFSALSPEPGDVLGYVWRGNIRYLGTVLDAYRCVVSVLISPGEASSLADSPELTLVSYEPLLSYDLQLSLLSKLLSSESTRTHVSSNFTQVDVKVDDEYPLKLFTGEAELGELRCSQPRSARDVKEGFMLDESQVRAVSAALGLGNHELLLIVGPPGTGKTRVIAKIAHELAGRGEKVLIASHTNRAVDNAIELLPLDNTLRVGRPEKVLRSTEPYLLSYKYRTELGERLEKLEREIGWYIKELRSMYRDRRKYRTGRWMVEEIISGWKRRLRELIQEKSDLIQRTARNIIGKVSVIGSTLIKSQLYPLKEVTFDTVIIDEASQASIALALLAMVKARKWILVGDHKQLPPIFSGEASRYGEELSAFNRLKDMYPHRHLWLTIHYRSNKAIIEFSAKHIYEGRIRPHESCALKKLRPRGRPKIEALTPEKPVVFIHTPSKEERVFEGRDRCTKRNPIEAAVVKELVSELMRCGLPSDAVGVITPYRGQRALIESLIKDSACCGVEVGTVDAFQGREKDVIIYDVVSTTDMRFPANTNRLNVALTRAKLKLIAVGNVNAIRGAPDAGLLREFIKYCLERDSVFDWGSGSWVDSASLPL